MSEDWKTWRVLDVVLPIKPKNALMAYNPEMTLGDLHDMPEREAYAIPNLGRTGIRRIMEALRAAEAGTLNRPSVTLGQRAQEIEA